MLRSTLIAVLLAAALPGQDPWELTPVEVGSGPLYFFTSSDARSEAEGRPRLVLDPESGEGPREFLRCPGNTRIRDRVEPGLILLQSFQEHRGIVALDVSRGRWTQLAVGNDAYAFATGGEVVFIADPARKRGGAHLMARDVRGTLPARAVLARPVHEPVYPALARHEVFVLTAGPGPAELWRVGLDGAKSRRVTTLRGGEVVEHATVVPSPSGRLVALSVAEADHLFDQRALRVIETASGEVLREIAEISVQLSPLSSSMPSLEMTWLDEGRRLRYSETWYPEGSDRRMGGRFRWVDLDVVTGKRLAVHDYDGGGIFHTEPPPGALPVPEHSIFGFFVRAEGRAWFLGEETPAADVRNERGQVPFGDLSFSPDGRWAMARRAGEHGLALLDGRERTRRTVWTSWSYDGAWR
jgi:hypothetical protein